MSAEVRIHTKVLPGHRIEVMTPEFSKGIDVDVMIVPSDAATLSNPSELRQLPIDERRRILAQSAEGMVEYYESTAEERIEWQGGEIVE